jgi:hypothetical protein
VLVGGVELFLAWIESVGRGSDVQMVVLCCCGGWLSVIAGRPESFLTRERHQQSDEREASCRSTGRWCLPLMPEPYINNPSLPSIRTRSVIFHLRTVIASFQHMDPTTDAV